MILTAVRMHQIGSWNIYRFLTVVVEMPNLYKLGTFE